MEQKPLSASLFELLAELYPPFIQILGECKLNGPEYFSLSFLRRSRSTLEGRPARLISEVANALELATGSGKSQASHVLSRLHERGFLEKKDITGDIRRTDFKGQRGGKNKVVVLLPAGEQVLNQFNSHVTRLFRELVHNAGISAKMVRFLDRNVGRIAPKLTESAHEQAKQWLRAR